MHLVRYRCLKDKEYISRRVARLQRHAQAVANSLRLKAVELKVGGVGSSPIPC